MIEPLDSVQSRRALIRSALVVAGGMAVTACTTSGTTASIEMLKAAPPVPVPQAPPAPVLAAKPQPRGLVAPAGVRPRAVPARDGGAQPGIRCASPSHDRIVIADFAVPSSLPRFFLINLGTGKTESLLVAHGSGSDPEHTGFLHRFSNDPGIERDVRGGPSSAPTIISASMARRSG